MSNGIARLLAKRLISQESKLSEKRAEAVVNYLEKDGISADELVPHGYGKTNCRDQQDPRGPCSEPASGVGPRAVNAAGDSSPKTGAGAWQISRPLSTDTNHSRLVDCAVVEGRQLGAHFVGWARKCSCSLGRRASWFALLHTGNGPAKPLEARK
jgi:hypothetical protein